MFFNFIFFIALFTSNIYASNQNDDDWKTEPGEIAANLQSNNAEKAGAASAAVNDEQEELPLFFQFIQAYSVDGIVDKEPFKVSPIVGIDHYVKHLQTKSQIESKEWFLQKAPQGGSAIIKVFQKFIDELNLPKKMLLDLMGAAIKKENGKITHNFTAEQKPILKALQNYDEQFFKRLKNSVCKSDLQQDIFDKTLCDLLYIAGFFDSLYNLLAHKVLTNPNAYELMAGCLQKLGNESAALEYIDMLAQGNTYFAFDGVTELTTTNAITDEKARLCRSYNLKRTYATMLYEGETNLAFDGKTILSTNDDINKEVSRILREDGSSHAKYIYFHLLADGATNISFDGKTLDTKQKINTDKAKLLRECQFPEAKIEYANLLQKKETNLAFNGKTILSTNDDINKEVSRILREAGTPDAKYSYTSMLYFKETNLTFDGKTRLSTDADINKESSKLLREAGTPDAKYLYAIMLMQNKTNLSFDGKNTLTTSEELNEIDLEIVRLTLECGVNKALDIYAYMMSDGRVNRSFYEAKILNNPEEISEEIAMLLRTAKTPRSILYYSLMLINKETNRNFANTNTLETQDEIKKEIIDLLDQITSEDSELLFQKELILESLNNQFFGQNIFEVAESHAATGNQDAEKMLDELEKLEENEPDNTDKKHDDTTISFDAATSEAKLDSTETTQYPAYNNKSGADAAAQAIISKEPNKELTKGTLRQQKFKEIFLRFTDTKRNTLDNNIGCQNYQVIWDTGLEKSSKCQEVQANYKSVFEKLIEAIKNGTKEGQPEALKGKTPDGLRQYSRRISLEHRLVYAYDHKNKTIHIIECGGHYGQ